MKRLFILFTIIIFCYTSIAQVWSGDLNGIDSIWNESSIQVNPITMHDICNYKDSLLYLGGAFKNINSQTANGIARWDGQNIYYFENGFSWGAPKAIIKYKDTSLASESF